MELSQLYKAVIEQLGYSADNELTPECMNELEDIANNGADVGWPGFTYYSDTVKFFEENKKEIVSLAKEMSVDLGASSTVEFINGFRCLKNVEVEQDQIAEVIYGIPRTHPTYTPNVDDDTYTQIANALAWFALEETARKLTDD